MTTSASTLAISIDDILAARVRIGNSLPQTSVLGSRTLAARAGARSVALKCESLQRTGSFKVRGALNAVSQLTPAERAAGVVTVSAGNHAQALAWAAASIGIPCNVVMPAAAAETKANASAGYGATVVRHGTNAEAFQRARELSVERRMTLIHPFDDARVIAGAGTVGLELVEQTPDADLVVVPIGGGGLIAGIATAVRARLPRARVIGVEPEGAASMHDSLLADRPMRAARLETMADGLASPMAGELTFPMVRSLVDQVVLVTEAEIADAVAFLLSRAKLVAEPAGAAGVAALIAGKVAGARDARVVCVLSGGNVDAGRLIQILSDRAQ